MLAAGWRELSAASGAGNTEPSVLCANAIQACARGLYRVRLPCFVPGPTLAVANAMNPCARLRLPCFVLHVACA